MNTKNIDRKEILLESLKKGEIKSLHFRFSYESPFVNIVQKGVGWTNNNLVAIWIDNNVVVYDIENVNFDGDITYLGNFTISEVDLNKIKIGLYSYDDFIKQTVNDDDDDDCTATWEDTNDNDIVCLCYWCAELNNS